MTVFESNVAALTMDDKYAKRDDFSSNS